MNHNMTLGKNKIFRNNKERFEKNELCADLSGLWIFFDQEKKIKQYLKNDCTIWAFYDTHAIEVINEHISISKLNNY